MYLRTLLFILLFASIAYFLKGPWKKYAGLFLMLLGGMTIGGLGLSFIAPEQALSTSELFTVLIGLGISPAGLGFYMFKKQSKVEKDEKQKTRARKIIKLARRNAGKVTVLDTAEHLNIDIEDARKLLQYMQLRGILDLAQTKEGVMVYQLMTLEG